MEYYYLVSEVPFSQAEVKITPSLDETRSEPSFQQDTRKFYTHRTATGCAH